VVNALQYFSVPPVATQSGIHPFAFAGQDAVRVIVSFLRLTVG
jgi:hypothetical protein